MKKILVFIGIISLIILNFSLSYSQQMEIIKSPVDPSPIILTAKDLPEYIPPNVVEDRLEEDYEKQHSPLEIEHYKKLNEKYKGELYNKGYSTYIDLDNLNYVQIIGKEPFTETKMESFGQEWGLEGWGSDSVRGKRWGIGYPVTIGYTIYPNKKIAKHSLAYKSINREMGSNSPRPMTGGLSEAEKKARYYVLSDDFKNFSNSLQSSGFLRPPLGTNYPPLPLADESWSNRGMSELYLRKGRIVVHICAPRWDIEKIAQRVLIKIEKSKLY
jgi:hypothetical protein